MLILAGAVMLGIIVYVALVAFNIHRRAQALITDIEPESGHAIHYGYFRRTTSTEVPALYVYSCSCGWESLPNLRAECRSDWVDHIEHEWEQGDGVVDLGGR